MSVSHFTVRLDGKYTKMNSGDSLAFVPVAYMKQTCSRNQCAIEFYLGAV